MPRISPTWTPPRAMVRPDRPVNAETYLASITCDSMESFYSAGEPPRMYPAARLAEVEAIGPVQALAGLAKHLWAFIRGQRW